MYSAVWSGHTTIHMHHIPYFIYTDWTCNMAMICTLLICLCVKILGGRESFADLYKQMPFWRDAKARKEMYFFIPF